MSVSGWALLRQQIATGDYELALQAIPHLTESKATKLADCAAATRHAVYARRPELVLALLEGSRRFLDTVPLQALPELLETLTDLLAVCIREKQLDPAWKITDLGLGLIGSANSTPTVATVPLVVKFAGLAGRYALRRNDNGRFAEIAAKTADWATRDNSGQSGTALLEAIDSWLHRIGRYDRVEAIPAVFEALSALYTAADKHAFLTLFLQQWRAVAAIACLNPESPAASILVEQLLTFAVRGNEPELWPPVTDKIGEVAALAVTRHGVVAGLPVFRPLLDVGRIQLNDELKFGTGPDTDNPRQRIIRLVCLAALKIADVAAHGDMTAAAGDKIEEMYRTWMSDPRFEPHARSIQRFCQLLLIFWSNNRKRAARKWAPREKALSEPLLLSEEDRQKLSFLL
jgi:hypothetical protein